VVERASGFAHTAQRNIRHAQILAQDCRLDVCWLKGLTWGERCLDRVAQPAGVGTARCAVAAGAVLGYQVEIRSHMHLLPQTRQDPEGFASSAQFPGRMTGKAAIGSNRAVV
jgi:hypothetical protein